MDAGLCCGTTAMEEKMLKAVEGRLESLLEGSGEMHYKKDQVIFYEGHYPHGFFVLRQGEITMSRTTIQGETEDLTIPAKKVFGLFHLVTNTPHCATAHAKTSVVVSFVPKSSVLEILSGFSSRGPGEEPA